MVALALSCAAHILGGGAPPRLLQMLVLAVGTGAVSLLLTGRRRGTLTIGLALAADQAVTHLVLMGLSVPTSCGAVLGGNAMAAPATAPITTDAVNARTTAETTTRSLNLSRMPNLSMAGSPAAG